MSFSNAKGERRVLPCARARNKSATEYATRAMGKRRPITVGKMEFAAAKLATEYVRSLVARYVDDAVANQTDTEFLNDLLELHPRCEEKLDAALAPSNSRRIPSTRTQGHSIHIPKRENAKPRGERSDLPSKHVRPSFLCVPEAEPPRIRCLLDSGRAHCSIPYRACLLIGSGQTWTA